MNFEYAVEARSKGFTVRRKAWPPNFFWNKRTISKNPDALYSDDINAIDWEIVITTSSFDEPTENHCVENTPQKFKNYSSKILAEEVKKAVDNIKEKSLAQIERQQKAVEGSQISLLDSLIDKTNEAITQLQRENFGIQEERIEEVDDIVKRLHNNVDGLQVKIEYLDAENSVNQDTLKLCIDQLDKLTKELEREKKFRRFHEDEVASLRISNDSLKRQYRDIAYRIEVAESFYNPSEKKSLE